MNSGEAISAAVLTGLLAGELHELAKAPENGHSAHALSDTHRPNQHLHYQLPQVPSSDVTVPITDLQMTLTTGVLTPLRGTVQRA